MHLEIDGRIKWVNTCIQQEGLAFCRYYISESCSVVSDSLRPHRLYSPWSSLGQNTGVGSCSLLQGTFPSQGSNLGLQYCRQMLYQLSHQRSPQQKPRDVIVVVLECVEMDQIINTLHTHIFTPTYICGSLRNECILKW